MDSKFIIIGLLFNPISFFLIAIGIDLVRCVFPTKAEKQAMQIVNDKRNDTLHISVNYNFRDDKEKALTENISRLSQRINENKRKIEVLNAGLKKVSAFAKRKNDKIKKRINELETANKSMRENFDAARYLLNKMSQYQEIKNARLGDVVSFGKYRWKVVQIEGHLRLLLCLFVISATCDHGGWAEGSLRYSCQELHSKFDDLDKELMVLTKNPTKNESVITKDYFFVFSPEQLADLPDIPSALKAKWAESADDDLLEWKYDFYGGDVNFDRGWWLRAADGETAYIDPDGRFKNYDASQGIEICGFRPAVLVSVK